MPQVTKACRLGEAAAAALARSAAAVSGRSEGHDAPLLLVLLLQRRNAVAELQLCTQRWGSKEGGQAVTLGLATSSSAAAQLYSSLSA